jgi:hypothetical protein
MPLITLRVAAELTGKDRSTLTRAIENGKLSASKNDLGRYLVDPAELERVYGMLRTPAVRPDAPQSDAQAAHSTPPERELALVREMLERERAHHERERNAYERDRQSWEEERTFLRSIVERRDEQLKLLTDQREQAPRPGFWQRMLRRA